MYGWNNTATGYYTHATLAFASINFFLPLKFDLELGPKIYLLKP